MANITIGSIGYLRVGRVHVQATDAGASHIVRVEKRAPMDRVGMNVVSLPHTTIGLEKR
jgi:hypothetical protein